MRDDRNRIQYLISESRELRSLSSRNHRGKTFLLNQTLTGTLSQRMREVSKAEHPSAPWRVYRPHPKDR